MASKIKSRIWIIILFVIITVGTMLLICIQNEPLVRVDIYHKGVVDRRLTYRLYENGKLIITGILERPYVENTLTLAEQEDSEKVDRFQKEISDFYMKPINWLSPKDIYLRWLMPVSFFRDVCYVEPEDMERILSFMELTTSQPEPEITFDNPCLLRFHYHEKSVESALDMSHEASSVVYIMLNCDMSQNGRRPFLQPKYENPQYTISKMLPRFLLLFSFVFVLCFAIVKAVVWIVRKISLVKLYRNHLFGFRT